MPTNHVLVLDETTFDDQVLASELPVLVDFTATWCPPCRALAPIIDAFAREYAGSLRVAVVDIDHAPGLARRFAIRGAPTVIAFRDGREIGRHAGACRASTLLALVAP